MYGLHNNSPRIIEVVLELAIIQMIAHFADKIEAIIIDGTISKNRSMTTIATQDIDFYPCEDEQTAQRTNTLSQTLCI